MDMQCLNNLVGLKSLCNSSTPAPVFYIDDIEGMYQKALADLAKVNDGSGQALAKSLIESSIRLMMADIDSLIPADYKINTHLTSVCSSCSFSFFYNNATTNGSGILIKNMSNSRFSSIVIDSLKIKTNTTGSFVLRIIDKEGLVKDITQNFIAGEELSIVNIGYVTTSKQVSIYFTNTTVQLFTITCPTGSSCGCGGSATATQTDIVITGLSNGIESSQQVGILPCVQLKCSYDDIICELVNASPRLFGLSLLYLFASKAFEENVLSTRVNRNASYDKENKKSESERYYALYRERLTGNNKKSILGVSQAINNNLKTITDKCITCNSPVGIAWATG